MSERFQHWLESDRGREFLAREQRVLGNVSTMLSGKMGLQVTLAGHKDYLGDINVATTVYVSQQSSMQLENTCLAIADTEALPFDSNEFNVVVAPYLSAVSDDPRTALREIYRVTAPEGQVLLSGFNPFSLLGIQSATMRRRYPLGHQVSLGRMKDWLKLLGFEIVAGSLFHYSPLGVQNFTRFSGALEAVGDRWLPMTAGAYVLVVKKRVFSQTLINKKAKPLFKPGKLVKSLAQKS